MRERIKLTLGLVLVAPILAVGSVAAIAREDGADRPAYRNGARVLSAETDASNNQTQKNTLKERLDKRKADLKTKLTASQQTRLKTRCKAAQGMLSSVKGRIQGVETSRGAKYDNAIAKLTGISEKLQGNNIDTTAFDSAVAELQTKVGTFKTDLDAYKTAVGDLAEMDCETDPDGFKASLEAARTALQVVRADTQAIRTQIKDVIKPQLASIRSQLSDEKAEQ